MVDRYNTIRDCLVRLSTYGEYVLYEDYEKLQAENEDLKKALKRFGHHDSPCSALLENNEDEKCICGFDETLKIDAGAKTLDPCICPEGGDHDFVDKIERQLEEAAEKAKISGNREDLQAYLKLRNKLYEKKRILGWIL